MSEGHSGLSPAAAEEAETASVRPVADTNGQRPEPPQLAHLATRLCLPPGSADADPECPRVPMAQDEGADQDDDLDVEDDDMVPYCLVCGQNVSMFYGLTGWQHFRGKHAPGSRRQLFEPDHETEVGWRPTNPDAAPAELTEPRAERPPVPDGRCRDRAEKIRACEARIRQLELIGEVGADVAPLLDEAIGYLGELAEIIGRTVTPW